MSGADDLGERGRELWDAVADAFALEPHHAVMLASACRLADTIAELEDSLAGGLIVVGSKGQPRLSGAVTELRQHRLALSRLLADLNLPPLEDAEDVPTDPRAAAVSRRASHAATMRWRRDKRGMGGVA